MTTYEYDGSGRLLRSVTLREPEFSPWDVAAMLEDRRVAGLRRGPHGLLMSEAMDPENQFAFEAEGPVTDWAQAKLDEARDAYRKKYPDANMSALHWAVRRRSTDSSD